MPTSRFEQIEAIYQAVLKLRPEERNVYLSGACANDPELRREVETLLAQLHAGGRATALADSTVTVVNAGTQLGLYKIEALIGARGMGQVFLARNDAAEPI